jgi:hypothetical protein
MAAQRIALLTEQSAACRIVRRLAALDDVAAGVVDSTNKGVVYNLAERSYHN